MNHYLKDHFRRWWWMFLIVAVAQGAMMEPTAKTQRLAPILSLFAGVIPWMIDTFRGFLRPVLQMPIGRRELAVRIWQTSVFFPSVLTFLVVLAAHLISGTPRLPIFPDWTAPFFCGFIACVTNGVMFATFSGMPPGRPKASHQVLVLVHLAITFACVLGPMVSIHLMRDPLWLALTYGLASLSTWIGWRNRDNLISGSAVRPMAHLEDQMVAIPRTNPRAPAGNAGWQYLFWSTAKMYIIWAAIIGVMMWLFGYLLTAMSGMMSKRVVGNFFSVHNPGAIVMWLMIVAISLRPVFQPRVLRMLPIRPAVLAALMLGMPLLASMVTMGLAVGVISLFSNEPSMELVWNRTSQLVVFFVVGIPVILRWGMSAVSITLLITGYMIFVGVTSEYPNLIPIPALVPAAVVSYWLIHRLLTRSSAPYRSAPTWLPAHAR